MQHLTILFGDTLGKARHCFRQMHVSNLGQVTPISRVALRIAGSLQPHGDTEYQQGTKAQLHLFCKSSFTFTMPFDVVNSERQSAVT